MSTVISNGSHDYAVSIKSTAHEYQRQQRSVPQASSLTWTKGEANKSTMTMLWAHLISQVCTTSVTTMWGVVFVMVYAALLTPEMAITPVI